MFVFVLNQDGKPLMPCHAAKARKPLRAGKAKVIRRTPFTIRLLWDCETHVQEVIAGMDTGSKKLGCAVVINNKVVYCSEVQLRSNISRKMKQRAAYRRTRRGRKTRYRPVRFNNRAASRRSGRLAPSVQSKLESHVREKRFVESILPVTSWIVETANFDIHRITNPEVAGRGYQEGPQQGYLNTKTYVLHRDGYACQHKQKGIEHTKKLHVHHIVWRRAGGSDAPDNLVTLCSSCHDALHAGTWELPNRKRKMSKTKHATHMGIVQARLKASDWVFEETFGYLTKHRRQQLDLSKSHINDAITICVVEGVAVAAPKAVLYKRHVAAGDYRQTKGKRSEIQIPTGRLFGLRKFDLIKTTKGTGFVKGKRSSGCFAIADVCMNLLFEVSVKRGAVRLAARTTTLTERRGAAHA